MKNAFIFDINKCVACHACVIACINENNIEIPENWRQIDGFNELRHPELPVFYYSIACNHCDDAPCMKNCPANAYTKDPNTGAIIHHAERCIGCKYCTWACPYDAPIFNKNTRIIEKCTFCNHRLEENLKPACVLNCPVGALDFGKMEINNSTISPAFSESGIGPSIHLVPWKNKKPIITDPELLTVSKEEFLAEIKPPSKKITAIKEWPLVLFTKLASFLVAWFFSFELLNLNFESLNFQFEFNIYFISLGIVGAILSLAHVGKVFRSYRSIFNLKTSWLSREILLYLLFMIGSIANYFFDSTFIKFTTTMAGILCLISIDMVYKIVVPKLKLKIDSSWVIMSFLLYTFYFIDLRIFYLFLILKTVIYFINKHHIKGLHRNYSMVKFVFSFLFPILLTIFHPEHIFLILGCIILGELIGRIEFYNSLKTDSTKREIFKLITN